MQNSDEQAMLLTDEESAHAINNPPRAFDTYLTLRNYTSTTSYGNDLAVSGYAYLFQFVTRISSLRHEALTNLCASMVSGSSVQQVLLGRDILN